MWPKKDSTGKLLNEALDFPLEGEDNGFLDRMFKYNSRIDKESFCEEMGNELYFFLQPHMLRQIVYSRISAINRDGWFRS